MSHNKEFIFFALIFINFFSLASSQDNPILTRVYFVQDSVPLNEEIELVCEFSWPVETGNIVFQPLEDFEYINLVSRASGSRNSLLIGPDSSTYFKKAFHYYFNAKTLGEAAITNLGFRYRIQGNPALNTIFFEKQSISITAPGVEADEHRLGWLIIIIFFAINAVVMVIFARKRKNSHLHESEFSRKYLKAIKRKVMDNADILNKDTLLLFFWELWELQFHLDKSSALDPLPEETQEKLGLIGNEVKEFEKAISVILDKKDESLNSSDRERIIKAIRLMIQKREKQLL